MPKTSTTQSNDSAGTSTSPNPDPSALRQAWGPLGDYLLDATQRTILFWDVMRRRSEQDAEQKARPVPHVLSFDAELVLDGRTFARPVNYLLVRIRRVVSAIGQPDGARAERLARIEALFLAAS